MGFWDNVNDELKKAVGESWSAVKENAKMGKLRLKANSLHKKAERHFSEIGGKVYEIYNTTGEEKANPLESHEVIRLVEEIRAAEAQVSEIKAEIAKIKRGEESAGRKEAAGKEPPAEEKAEEAGEEKEEEKDEEDKKDKKDC